LLLIMNNGSGNSPLLFAWHISLPQGGIQMTGIAGAVIPSDEPFCVAINFLTRNLQRLIFNFQCSIFNAQVPIAYLCISVRWKLSI